MRLYERFRPTTLDDVAGQSKAVAQIRGILERTGFGGRAVWIAGPSGTGKTTLARIIAASVADPFNIREYDSGHDFRSADVDECESISRLYGMGERNGRAFIVNEAHGLRGDIVTRLLGVLERAPDHVCWVFTTTWAGESLFADNVDAGAFASRVIPIGLTNQGFTPAIAEHVRSRCVAAGIDGYAPEVYLKAARSVKGNARALWQLVEQGALAG